MPSSVSSNSGSGPVRSAGEGPPRESADAGSTWETAWGLVRFAAGVDPRAIAATVAMALASSLTGGGGLALLLPLLAVAGMNFTGSTAAGPLGAASPRGVAGAGGG